MSLGPNAALNGFVPFPADNAWNTDISASPRDPNSDTITGASAFVGLHLHPDFGSNFGIPYTVVDSHQNPQMIPINVSLYPGDSDVVIAPYSSSTLIEGNPADCAGWPDLYIGDAHSMVLDRATCWLYETYDTHHCNGAFNADAQTIWDMQSNEMRPFGWTSVDAAGLSVFAGLIRYDEVASGSMNHAIRYTMVYTKNNQNNGYFVPPASHAAGTNWGTYNVIGMRIRLKASFDISGFSAMNQVILRTMKKYGMILADNGGYFYFQGAPDSRWDDNDLDNLKTIGSANFEVVQPSVPFPGYDENTHPSGPIPTITSFTASASTVPAGTPVTLSWSSTGASYEFVDLAGPSRTGSITTLPTATTTYTLNSSNQYGRSTRSLTITVTGAPPPPPSNPAPALTMPVLNFPSSVPLNTSLSFSYSTNFPNLQFSWSLIPVDTGTGVSPVQATTSFPNVGLSQWPLVPGRYAVSVYASDASTSTPTATQTITLVTADLATVRVYPNPWRNDQHAAFPITFDSMAAGSSVTLFTVSGHKVKDLNATNGSAVWDLTSDGGDHVSSGIYLYVIKDGQNHKLKGKLAVIR